MLSILTFSLVFAILSLIVNVNSQTCYNSPQYSACSSNSECGCLSYSFSDSMGICGLVSQNCSQFVPCQSVNNACEQSEHICIRHPRCDSRPLCYPLSMAGQTVCPPLSETIFTRVASILTSNYSSALTKDDGRYKRPGSLYSTGFLYEAIQIIVDTTGTYSLASLSDYDTNGYLYNDTFYPLTPSDNLIQQDDDNGGNRQFKVTAFLQAGVPYTLVLSTQSTGYSGPFTIVGSGPGNVQYLTLNPMEITTTTSTTTQSSIITSDYVTELTGKSASFPRDDNTGSLYYYNAIEVTVSETGTYTFTSSSGMDTYGYLYQGNFYPSHPSFNVLSQDDNSGGGYSQFQLIATLRDDMKYILVVTTSYQYTTGIVRITASGPGNVTFNPISINTQ